MSKENREFIKHNRTILLEKLKESLSSVLPVTIIVFILSFIFFPIKSGMMLTFIIGAVMLILGMGLFTLGADIAMMPIGEHVGSAMTRSRKIWLILLVAFIVGTAITISEPDLTVLAEQVPGIPGMVLVVTVAVGVGLFLLLAMLRIIFKIRFSYLLVGLYIAVFILAFFIPKEFLSVAFDSGGVTTGPMTVPFILALGVGVSSIRSDKDAQSDSFGLVGLCSVGPILAVLILGVIYKGIASNYEFKPLPDAADTQKITMLFGSDFPHRIMEVAIALIPIIVFFGLFQIIVLKLKKGQIIRIVFGLIYTYVGLVLFLTGVNVGFMPLGSYLGQIIGSLTNNWIIVPIGMVIGYFIVIAEPAVHVLNKQVVEITSGAIPKKAITTSLSIGVSVSVGLSMVRILTGLPLMYFLIPGYAIALALTFFVPKIFTAIAFDSGGVASGPMTATFLLPLAIGVCLGVGGNVVVDAFGIVAMVAMTPLITIQALGVYYRVKVKSKEKQEKARARKREKIINFE